MKKVFSILIVAIFAFSAAWDLQAQCRRGEIMTDAGCVKQSRKKGAKPPTEADTRQAAKQALHDSFKFLENSSSDLKNYLEGEATPVLQRLMGKINGANVRTKNPQSIRSRFFPTWDATKTLVQESGDSYLTNLIENYEAVAQAGGDMGGTPPAPQDFSRDAPVVISENPQKFVKVDYRYDKNGRLIAAKGKGSFKIEDGFGAIHNGTINQDYQIINGQAKLTKNDTLLNTKRPDGAHSKQNITVQYRYDKNGKFLSAVGGGKLTGDDGFGNTTKSNIEQVFAIIGGQAKSKEDKIDSKIKNTDGSWKSQDLTVTYSYDSKGRMKNCRGSGTFIADDGFGNSAVGTISQIYKVVNGRPQLVASKENKKEEITPAGRRGRRFVADPASIVIAPPPPPPPPSQQKDTAWRRAPEPQQEEAAPQDCGEGMHWSPTLKSCQPD